MAADELAGDDNIDESESIKNLNASLDEIISDFTDVDSLIIDVRMNGGGDDFVSQMIVSRLI
jgi:C-terminal processing protease CtpA/Prc